MQNINDILKGIPQEIVALIEKIEANGEEAYIVGGAVRDLVMGKAPNDFDICTSASSEKIKEIFPKHFALGEKYGTISVFVKDKEYVEVTTFREDMDYKDGRRPSQVLFTKDIIKDLERRDFTINAIAFAPSKGLVDPFDGLSAIKEEKITAVGEPKKRFQEDGLRILRAVRFSSKFGFEIEDETKKQMKNCMCKLDSVSKERFADEFVKILRGKNVVNAIDENAEILAYIMPEFEPLLDCPQNSVYHIYDVLGHTLRVVESIKDDKVLKLAAFFHDFGKPASKTTDDEGFDHFKGHPEISMKLAKQVLKRLKYGNKIVHDVLILIEYHDSLWYPTLKNVKKIIGLIGYDLFDMLIELVKADNSAKAPRVDTSVDLAVAYRNQIEEENQAISLKELKVRGYDIMTYLGIEGSPVIGEILEELLELVIEDEDRNKKGHLLKEAKKIYNNLVN